MSRVESEKDKVIVKCVPPGSLCLFHAHLVLWPFSFSLLKTTEAAI